MEAKPSVPILKRKASTQFEWLNFYLKSLHCTLCRLDLLIKSALESANLGLESADSSANSNTNPVKIGVWVRASSSKVIKRLL